MQIQDLKGPGYDQWVIERLQSWGIKAFTEIQTLAISAGVADGKSTIISAPTSSGKTLVGEIAVLCALRNSKKSIYLVSHKALADQKYSDFRKRFGEESKEPIATVGLSTGDREEGDFAANLVVATYERALGLLLSGELASHDALVVADELQIVGEEGRGPNIETLLALLRQRGVFQFIALTATVENPPELAQWLNCQLVQSTKRDIPLFQEIWFRGEAHGIRFGETSLSKIDISGPLPNDVLEVVTRLLNEKRGPVLVFTETRPEALRFAAAYSQKRARAANGLEISDQLELFSEPTEASDQLRQTAERGVAFHTADLSPQERQVIEQGFVDARFDVCFATSTLAAGVNFPFQTVVFPKLTYEWRNGARISRGEYRNMSGRAGRLGLHNKGFSVLLPSNDVERGHASKITLPENDKVVSQLLNLSMRRSVLMLIASGVVDSEEAARSFFQNTLFWHQTSKASPDKLARILQKADEAIGWLVEAKMAERHERTVVPSPLGKATAIAGLLPSTSADFVRLLANHKDGLEAHFDQLIPAILHWACSSDEFLGATPSRFLPFPTGKSDSSTAFLSGQKLFRPLDRTNTQLARCSHALILYVHGVPERRITRDTGVSSGRLHSLALDVGWLIEGLQRISCVRDLECSQQLTNQMAMLSRRVRWGAPVEVLDVMRIAEKHSVPGFGRVRAMELVASGLNTFEDILGSTKEKLMEVLRNERRVKSLLGALSSVIGFGPDRYANMHGKVAKELGIHELVEQCNKALGKQYESAIAALLEREQSWDVKIIDGDRRQNVPDIILKLGEIELLIECKTCTKNPPLINKDDAFAILQKGSDFDPRMHKVTLGKPTFDEHSKGKAQATPNVTLVEHRLFLEAVLRVLSGNTTPKEVMVWLSTPGLSELNRMPGKPSYTK